MRLYNINGYTGQEDSGIGDNSMALTETCFVNKAAGVVSKAVATGVISGVNTTIATFAADNESGDLATASFRPAFVDATYEVAITGGTITVADEGKFYDLSDEKTVDGTTESTSTGQVQLVKFISATNSVFRIANA